MTDGTDTDAADSCIFCKIIKGEIPCSKLYEDKSVFVFLDISPVNKGHALVIPKEHHETLLDAPDEVVSAVAVTVKKVAAAVKKGTGCDGINVVQSNYPAAGQLVGHLHFHVIPRFSEDGLKHWPQGKYDEGEVDKFCEKIKSNIG